MVSKRTRAERAERRLERLSNARARAAAELDHAIGSGGAALRIGGGFSPQMRELVIRDVKKAIEKYEAATRAERRLLFGRT